MRSIANFLFETGMLKRTPRTGFQFLGSGAESVAEHTMRTVFIGYALSHLRPDVDRHRLLLLCLFHDFLEARTGDMNYMNKKYATVDEESAMRDALADMPFRDEAEGLFRELWGQETVEARFAKEADVLELLLQLKEQKDLGNPYAEEWMGFALQRLTTDEGRSLAATIGTTDSTGWWFDRTSTWWSQ